MASSSEGLVKMSFSGTEQSVLLMRFLSEQDQTLLSVQRHCLHSVMQGKGHSIMLWWVRHQAYSFWRATDHRPLIGNAEDENSH